MADNDSPSPRWTPFRITLVYVLIGSTWIAVSDRLLTFLKADSAALQTLKGVFFVLVTASILYALIRGLVSELVSRESRLLEREEQYRALSTRLVTIRDEERRQTALELQDSVGQWLAALSLHLRLLMEVSSNDLRTRASAEQCLKLANDALERIRSLSYGLHPPRLEQAGLTHALRWMANDLASRESATIELQLPEHLPRMSAELELSAFRIVQETLAAEPGVRNATVRFNLGKDDALMIRISIRGVVTTDFSLHTPMMGVQERVRRLGGVCEIANGSAGTTVEATLPLRSSLTRPTAPGY